MFPLFYICRIPTVNLFNDSCSKLVSGWQVWDCDMRTEISLQKSEIWNSEIMRFGCHAIVVEIWTRPYHVNNYALLCHLCDQVKPCENSTYGLTRSHVWSRDLRTQLMGPRSNPVRYGSSQHFHICCLSFLSLGSLVTGCYDLEALYIFSIMTGL